MRQNQGNAKMTKFKFIFALLFVSLAVSTSAFSSDNQGLHPVKSASLGDNFSKLLQRAGIIEDAQSYSFGADLTSKKASKVIENPLKKKSEALRQKNISAETELSPVLGLIVSFDISPVENELDKKSKISTIEAIGGEGLKYVRTLALGDYLFAFSQPRSYDSANSVREKISELSDVSQVSLDLRFQNSLVPNDTYLRFQHGLGNSAEIAGGTDAYTGWDITQGSSAIVVAVIDSGVRYDHPDLAGKLLPGYDFVSNSSFSNDGDGRDPDANDPGDWVDAITAQRYGCTQSDSSWHGTHVAGIVGAASNNGQGISGVDWRARILPVRALGKCGGSSSDILDAMAWAAGIPIAGIPNNPFPARVINMSLSGKAAGGCDWVMQKYIQAVKARNTLIVVAAGNSDVDITTEVPSSCKGVVTVGAVDFAGLRSSYSNYSFSNKVNLSAPGGDAIWYQQIEAGILSTWNTGKSTPATPDYWFKDGTSMAAPFVSGAASLALSVNPELTPPELTALLERTATRFTKPDDCREYFPICGAGIVNMARMVAAARYLLDYVTVAEYFNIDNSHFFRTGFRNEFAFVESGAVGRWVNTEDYFLGWKDGRSGALPVCRFYTPTSNSHFYTLKKDECEAVKTYAGWQYEGIAFYAKAPVNGKCPENTTAVHRFYNNRFAQLDSNHRFTIYGDFYKAELLSRGWIYEGIAMCGAS